MPTITFEKGIQKSGSSSKGPWTRYAFVANEEWYSTFDKDLADKIVVGQPTEVEIEVTDRGKNITAVLGGSNAEATQQSTQNPQNGSQAVRTAPVASQDDARGRTRAIIAAQLAPALFNSLPEDEQTMEAAKQIAEALVDYAFQP